MFTSQNRQYVRCKYYPGAVYSYYYNPFYYKQHLATKAFPCVVVKKKQKKIICEKNIFLDFSQKYVIFKFFFEFLS